MKWYEVSLWGWIFLALYVWSIVFSVIYAELVFVNDTPLYVNGFLILMFLLSSFAMYKKIRIFARDDK